MSDFKGNLNRKSPGPWMSCGVHQQPALNEGLCMLWWDRLASKKDAFQVKPTAPGTGGHCVPKRLHQVSGNSTEAVGLHSSREHQSQFWRGVLPPWGRTGTLAFLQKLWLLQPHCMLRGPFRKCNEEQHFSPLVNSHSLSRLCSDFHVPNKCSVGFWILMASYVHLMEIGT